MNCERPAPPVATLPPVLLAQPANKAADRATQPKPRRAALGRSREANKEDEAKRMTSGPFKKPNPRFCRHWGGTHNARLRCLHPSASIRPSP